LERTVKSLGFKWRKCQSKRNILIERADIVDWRSRYIVKIKEYRDEGHPIFYIDESWCACPDSEFESRTGKPLR
jgi:hypothetical protein